MDNCPNQGNTDQADTDSDMIGDVCDACPMESNANGMGCSATVYQVKKAQVPDNTPVRVEGVITAISPDNRGFFLQMSPDQSNYEGAAFSGVFVFKGTDMSAVPAVGTSVSISAIKTTFFGQIQLKQPTIATLAQNWTKPAFTDVPATDLATAAPQAAAYEGVMVAVNNVTVGQINLMSGPGDVPENREFSVDGGLVINDLFYLITPVSVGQTFNRIQGILRFANGNSKLEPLSANDVLQGESRVAGFSANQFTIRQGFNGVPVADDLSELQIKLTSPAPAGGRIITFSSNQNAISFPQMLTIPEGQLSASVMINALSAGNVTLEATSNDSENTTVQTTINVIATDSAPTQLTADPAQITLGLNQSATITLKIDLPARNQELFTVIDAQGFLNAPAMVTIPFNQKQITFDVQAQGEGSGNLTIQNGNGLSVTVPYQIQSAQVASGLVINEIDYDQIDADAKEFIEILNPTNSAISLANVSVKLINGSNNMPYATYDLSTLAPTLGAGQMIVLKNDTVMVPNGTLTVSFANNFFQNGPDGVQLLSGNMVIDSVSYEGVLPNVTEGMPIPNTVDGSDSNTIDVSLGRCPNGSDRQDNSIDFVRQTPSAGLANLCP
jgi:hypothetical protein